MSSADGTGTAGTAGFAGTAGIAGAVGVAPADEAGRLDARVVVRRGAFTLDVAIAAEPGDVLAVLGPNGAGKSTFLAVLAGLLTPDSGTVRVGGRVLTGPGIAIPPEGRRVGLMGQDPLLFPHLTAAENIAFGPRSQGRSRGVARASARTWLEQLGLAEFADRRPTELSGGQRQRVALARALAAEPELLLLDEPLAALDAQTAPEIRQVLRSYLHDTGTTTVLVTHDVLDAATLADRVAVMVDGEISDSGPTAKVLAAPRSSFSAALAGLNLIVGTVGAASPAATQGTTQADPMVTVRAPGISISGLAVEAMRAGAPAAVVFPPSAVAVYLDLPGGGSPRNTWPATIVALEPGPSAIRVRAQVSADATGGNGPATPREATPREATPREATPREATPREATPREGTSPEGHNPAADVVISADVTPAAVSDLRLAPGSSVYLTVKATEVSIYAR